MIRTIVKSDNNSLTLKLPDNLIGKVIEVIAFAVDEPKQTIDSVISDDNKLKDLEDKLKPFKVNSGGYKFNREEANDYE